MVRKRLHIQFWPYSLHGIKTKNYHFPISHRCENQWSFIIHSSMHNIGLMNSMFVCLFFFLRLRPFFAVHNAHRINWNPISARLPAKLNARKLQINIIAKKRVAAQCNRNTNCHFDNTWNTFRFYRFERCFGVPALEKENWTKYIAAFWSELHRRINIPLWLETANELKKRKKKKAASHGER